MHHPNFEKWNIYTSHLSSPQNYIEWGWRYLISASLQRRVWMGPCDGKLPDSQACFPNMYVLLIGPPGVGKGLVIREVSYFLKFWKMKDAIPLDVNGMPKEFKETAQSIIDDDLKKAQDKELKITGGNQAGVAEPLLIPVAADATTYEALVEAVGNSYRRCAFLSKDHEGNSKPGVYGHSSICFSLQELASLLRKRTDDIVNYLLGLYDCPIDYEYVTKTKGKDRVRRGCLNVLAGTTPGFMQTIFSDELVDEGFSSRIFAIYAQKNRVNQFWIPQLTDEQKECRTKLLEHVRRLASLYGPIYIDQETKEYLHDWWDKYNRELHTRANLSSRLIPYYARKNIHVMKVAMAEHFGESYEMHIPLTTFQKAIDILDKEEKNMHMAIVMETKNPLANITKRIIEILSTGEKNFVELSMETWTMASKPQLEEAISFLEMTNQTTREPKVDETGETVVYYKLTNK